MKEKKEFNEYIDAFKELPLQSKKEMTINEIKEILAALTKMKTDLQIEDEILFNREILDVNKVPVSEEDFVEAVFVYLHSIEESLGAYFEKIQDILYIDNEQE